ncbi:hypothetical protein IWQ62_005691, partial [Dispira parvispora]
VIANLVNGLGTGYRLHNDIKALYMESLYLDNFDTELISRPARNLGREKDLAISTEDLEHADFKSSAKKYQEICDRYEGMVADFLGPAKRYANVTFAGAKYVDNAPTKVARLAPQNDESGSPWKRLWWYF